MAYRRGTTKGFKQTASLLQTRIRKVSESRGFAQSRLLTRWQEIAGPDIAAIARPVEISYGHGGMGATLTLLTTGAQAPILEMQKEQIRTKVNAVYGYNAISRIRITQTAATGFAEGQVDFTQQKNDISKKVVDPIVVRRAADVARNIEDEGLRMALERLGTNIMKQKSP